ncbi:MAG TPA: SAM-dependent methyltransferase, partial [Gammaproteobacteria bacterium]
MSNQTLPLTPELYQYLLRVSLRESPGLRALREE